MSDNKDPGWIKRSWHRRGGTWWWAIAVIVVPVALLTAVGVVSLLTFVDPGGDPKNRIELLKIGLTIGAGTGGVVALVLAGRRQWSTEQSLADARHDATERRITELYLKAVDQLGSDKAPVRLTGLYALERLAQDNKDQRQTIVNVLCAYLRMPYQPARPGHRPVGVRRPLQTNSARRRISPNPLSAVAGRDTAQQERVVRLTAQRILATHLHRGDAERPVVTFWEDIDLDLDDATLVEFSLGSCLVRHASFRSATFVGEANFGFTTFTGMVDFGLSIFNDVANFNWTKFPTGALFAEVTFADIGNFPSASFGGTAFFRSSTFDEADFGSATFAERADFRTVNFVGEANFTKATFDDADFIAAKFVTIADFRQAAFGTADFRLVTFTGVPNLGEAILTRETHGEESSIGPYTDFMEATFAGDVPPEVTGFLAAK